MSSSRQKKRNLIPSRWIALFLALMFIVPFSSMVGSATSGATGGDSLIVEGKASPSQAEPGQTITFSAKAKFGNILEGMTDVTSSTSFVWNFGDGSTGTGNNVRHSYSSVGTYTVRVTGTYNSYTSSDQFTVTIRYLPVAVIHTSTTEPRAYLDSVHFDASDSYDRDGAIVSYEWDFGDGHTANTIAADHIFKEGTYTVTLTVTDNDGYKDTATVTINSNLPKYRITNTADNSTNPKVYYYQNQLKVFWIENGSSIMMAQSDDLGWTWSSPAIIFQNASEEITRIDMASDGEYIAIAAECSPPGYFPFLYILYSDDGGDTWYDSYMLRGDKASIDVLGENVYLAYRAWSHLGTPDFFLGIVIKWTEDGRVISHRLQNPSGDREFTGIPKIAVIPGENKNSIYVTVADYVTKHVYFWKSTDNGDTWSSPVIIGNLTDVKEDYMALKASDYGLYFIWSDNRMHNYELWLKMYRNGEWSEDILLTNALGTSFQPAVRVDEDGYVHVIWSDFRNCVYDIYETTLDGNGNTVKNDWKITTHNRTSLHPDMFIDSHDKAALTDEYYRFEVWQEWNESQGDYEIYFKNNVVDGYMGQTTESLTSAVQTAQDYIASLPDDYFSEPQRRKPLIKKYEVVGNLIEKGKYRAAARKVYHDISPKMDGFLGGNPNNDWIIVNTAQEYLGGINQILVLTTDPELPPNPPGGGSTGGSTGIDITDVTKTSTENTAYITWKVNWVTIQDHPTYHTEITLNGQTQSFDYLANSYGAQFTGLSAETTYSFTIYAEETSGTIQYTDTYTSSVTTKAHELRITVNPKLKKVITIGENENNNVESKATIEWWTNNPSNSTVKYREFGTNDDWSVVRKNAMVTHHLVTISGLNPETKYEYKVISENENYDQSPSAEGEPFTTPPAITGLGWTVEYTRAHFSWHTDMEGDTQIHYKLPSEEDFTSRNKEESVREHSLSIGDIDNPSERLWGSTRYLFYVQTVTKEGDAVVIMKSRIHDFTTEALITDLEWRDYYKPIGNGDAERGEIIKWTTSEATSTNYVNYWDKTLAWAKPESDWDTMDISGTSTKTHIVEIVTPISEKKGHEYVFKVYSETDDAQLVNSTVNTFTAIPDSDGDHLQDAEEEYGWTVDRDINGDGDMTDILPHPIYADKRVKEHLPAYGDVIDILDQLQNFNGKSFIFSPWRYADIDNDGLNDKEEKDHHTDPMNPDTDFDRINDGDEINTYSTDLHKSDTDLDSFSDYKEIFVMHTDPLGYKKWAILIRGGDKDDPIGVAFYSSFYDAYDTLKKFDYSDENIYLLYPGYFDANQDGKNDTDAIPTKNNVKSAIVNWLKEKTDGDDKIFIYFVDHGDDGGYLNLTNNEVVNSTELKNWLSVLSYSKLIILLESCYSGDFISDLSGENRIIITSSDGNHESLVDPKLGTHGAPAFSYSIFSFLRYETDIDLSIGNAFVYAENKTWEDINYNHETQQHPLLDDNGDGIGHNHIPLEGDGDLSFKTYLG